MNDTFKQIACLPNTLSLSPSLPLSTYFQHGHPLQLFTYFSHINHHWELIMVFTSKKKKQNWSLFISFCTFRHFLLFHLPLSLSLSTHFLSFPRLLDVCQTLLLFFAKNVPSNFPNVHLHLCLFCKFAPCLTCSHPSPLSLHSHWLTH